MNNDTNNNLNGTVLGNVNDNLNNNEIPNETIETLDGGLGNNVMNSSPLMNNSQSNSTVQSNFFNNPPANDMAANNQNVDGIVPQPSMTEPAPQQNPMPDYTNPQFINPAPMQGFENSGTIGTTPPISLEPEKKPKKKSNKFIFIFIILLLLAVVGFGTYYILEYTDLLNINEQANVTVKNLEVNMGDNLSNSIDVYATITGTDSKNCSLNTSEVDTTKVGVYNYSVTCGEIVKNGQITVVDNTELVVDIKTVYKVPTDTLEAKEFATEENSSLTYEFIDPDSIKGLLTGEYGSSIVKIKVTDQNGKTAEVEGKLVVTEFPLKGYLICSSNEQNVTNSSAVMTVAEKLAIVNDGNNGYGKYTEEIHTFKFTDETEYTNYLVAYKTDKTITINNITGKVSFDDENLVITITNEKDNNALVSEYGETNLQNYRTIRAYFQDTLGYNCIYQNNVNE